MTEQRTGAPIDLSLIIVNYNVRGFLEAMLQSVERASEGLRVEIIVVDNHSTDGSLQMIRHHYPDVRLIANKENRGFAAANNQALEIYRGRYACLVNPDVLLQENTLRVMVELMDRQMDVGAAGCKILNPDGSLQLACRRSIPTPMSAFFKLTGLSRVFPNSRRIGAYNMTYLDPDAAADVDAVSGSFMFVRREAIDQVGLLDETFFMYGEDLDWLYRMRQCGWRVTYVPATRIVHYKGESAKKSRRRPSFEFYRAMYIFAQKHRPNQGALFLTMLVNGFVTSGIVIKGGLSFIASGLWRGWLPLIDLATINITPLAGTLIRVGHLAPLTMETLVPYAVIHGTYSVVWMSCLYVSGLYGQRRFSATTAALAVTAGFVIIAALSYYTPSFAFSRVVILLAWIMNLTIIAGWRLVIGSLNGGQRRAIIVGTDRTGRAILSRLRSEMHSDYDIIAFLASDPRIIGTMIDEVNVLNGNGKLSDTLNRHKIDEVIVASSSVSYNEILQLVSSCNRLGVGLKLVANLENTEGATNHLETVSLVDAGSEPLIHFRNAVRRIRRRSEGVDPQ